MLKKLILPLCFLLPQSLFSAPLSSADFTYNATLSEANTSLRQFDLPVGLNAKIKRKDYGDVRIFNQQGQAIPHQFSHLKIAHSIQQKRLDFFPFSKEQVITPNNIQVLIQQYNQTNLGQQQSIHINQKIFTTNKNQRGNYPYQYIIKNFKKDKSSKVIVPLCKLKLDWNQKKANRVLGFKLESSDTLQHWRTLSNNLNVSKLNYAGSRIVNDEVSFNCTTEKYLRLTWLKPEQHTQLNEINGIYNKNTSQQMQSFNLGKATSDKKGNLYFESSIIATITKIEFKAPQDGLLYKGALYSRADNKAEWRFRKNINQFRLNLGETQLLSKPIELVANNNKYWKLKLDNGAQFSENQLPEIKLSWPTKQVIFLAQGKGPFLLSLGNPTIKTMQNIDLKSLIKSLKQAGSVIDKVKVGQLNATGKIFKTPSQTPWKQILLWLVLILGTLLMAFMAYRLYQQMGGKPDSNN